MLPNLIIILNFPHHIFEFCFQSFFYLLIHFLSSTEDPGEDNPDINDFAKYQKLVLQVQEMGNIGKNNLVNVSIKFPFY